jgi:hypothetical protein
MAERYQLPPSCVPPTTRRKDGGYPPSGGLEGGKTRCIREHEDIVAFQGGHPPFKGGPPYLRPSHHGLSLLQHTPRSSPTARGLGPTRHASRLRAEEAKPPRAVRTTAQRLRATLHFCPDQRAKGRAVLQAACNRAKRAHFSDSQHARHGGPGPRVMQPVRRLLRVSNCTATCATTAPPRLRNQYRDSKPPSTRPSGSSLARQSIRPKTGRQ